MYPKKGWILAAVFLVLCSVGCTGQTGETHRLYVQTAGSESQIAETLPTAEQAEWMDADSNVVSTKAVKSKKATKTTTKKKKSSKKKTTTKQKKETTAKVMTLDKKDSNGNLIGVDDNAICIYKSDNEESCENYQTKNNKSL